MHSWTFNTSLSLPPDEKLNLSVAFNHPYPRTNYSSLFTSSGEQPNQAFLKIISYLIELSLEHSCEAITQELLRATTYAADAYNFLATLINLDFSTLNLNDIIKLEFIEIIQNQIRMLYLARFPTEDIENIKLDQLIAITIYEEKFHTHTAPYNPSQLVALHQLIKHKCFPALWDVASHYMQELDSAKTSREKYQAGCNFIRELELLGSDEATLKNLFDAGYDFVIYNMSLAALDNLLPIYHELDNDAIAQASLFPLFCSLFIQIKCILLDKISYLKAVIEDTQTAKKALLSCFNSKENFINLIDKTHTDISDDTIKDENAASRALKKLELTQQNVLRLLPDAELHRLSPASCSKMYGSKI